MNKLLVLDSSGSTKNIIDLDNQSIEEIKFYNLDVYIYTVKEDITIIDKRGKIHNCKIGDTIVKSHCKDILYIDSTGSIKQLIDEIRSEEYKDKLKNKEGLDLGELSVKMQNEYPITASECLNDYAPNEKESNGI
jgi:hypothetical protein